ncbi:2-oxo acid dehydrogenase subunit E2 [Halostella sp. JP-L12]|uniref:dihydrolipoamide acetyltransferase family protein n=1 Tax=Halostella TaxID=1843185 RepID=UPI000EF8382C|nr:MULTISPECIES: 2-oxo acid dehydrogenase subunit E2 [Halostella]NHN45996.1 2-oxo acid dehydrogenase subunit E2 [Halostella sp. JP-L12]
MVREFKLPDVGEGVSEGEIVRWLVDEGDAVTEDQPVAEVETDKAVVEVPAPVDGTVREILADEGEMVPVGNVIITFDVEGEPVEEETEGEAARAASGEPEAEAEPAGDKGAETAVAADEETATPEGRVFAAPSARRLARELGVDIGAVDGSGPSGRVTEHDVRAAAEGGSEPAAATEASGADAGGSAAGSKGAEGAQSGDGAAGGAGATAEASGAAAGGRQVESADRDRTLAAPATRRIAEEEGVDLNAVPATEERDGEPFVTPEAVREYAQAQQEAQAADTEALAKRAEPAEREEREPYRGIRKTIGDAMERSKFTAPHITHHDQVVVTDLVETRGRLKEKAEDRGIKLTYMPLIMKAVTAALKEFPVVNASLDEENEEIVKKNYYNVGVATATDAGLMVPVVDDVDEKGLLQIASEMNELVQKARDRSIAREEMQGGTFTVTNIGGIGGEYATPIINHPEVAILALGAIKQRPVVEDGEVVARHTLPLSLSADHRIVDGADAARFTNRVKEYLKNPELLLLE